MRWLANLDSPANAIPGATARVVPSPIAPRHQQEVADMSPQSVVELHAFDSERGASAVEYAILAAAIAAVIALSVFAVGIATGGSFSTTCNNIEASSGGDLAC